MSFIRRSIRYWHRLSYEEPWLFAAAVFAGAGVLIPAVVLPFKKNRQDLFYVDHRVKLFDLVRSSYPSSAKMITNRTNLNISLPSDRAVQNFLNPDSVDPAEWEEWTSDIRWRLKPAPLTRPDNTKPRSPHISIPQTLAS